MVPEMQTRVSVQPVEATDDAFWDQFWADSSTTVQDVFALVPAAEIRAVREESPSNLATLCYKVRCSSRSRLKARSRPVFCSCEAEQRSEPGPACQWPALSDVGISESAPLPIPPLPLRWFQISFEAPETKQK